MLVSVMQFPALRDSVYGEESGKYSTHDGSEAVVEVCASVEETAAMLTNILGEGMRGVAQLLATEAHSEVAFEWSHHEETTCSELREFKVDLDHLGVWIDPIGKLVTKCHSACNTLIQLIVSEMYTIMFHCRSSRLITFVDHCI